MAEQRVTYWAAEAEVDEDLEDVDLNLAIGSFGQTDQYEDGASKSQNRTFYNATENSQRSSQAQYRRHYNACHAAADGATSFRPNPRRREEGVFAGVFYVKSHTELRTHSLSCTFTKPSKKTTLRKSRSHMKVDGTV